VIRRGLIVTTPLAVTWRLTGSWRMAAVRGAGRRHYHVLFLFERRGRWQLETNLDVDVDDDVDHDTPLAPTNCPPPLPFSSCYALTFTTSRYTVIFRPSPSSPLAVSLSFASFRAIETMLMLPPSLLALGLTVPLQVRFCAATWLLPCRWRLPR